MSELVSDTPSRPDLWFTMSLKAARVSCSVRARYGDESGIQIARARAHHQPRRRREAHAGVDALAVAHGGQARAVAKMGEDDPALRGRRIPQACEFFHQIGIRQTVEAVTPDTLRLVATRNRQELRDTRHGAMERRVEAGDLRQFRVTLAERFDELDLAGRWSGSYRADATQFIQQIRRDQLRLGMFHAVHNPMSHRLDRCETPLLFEPINQETSPLICDRWRRVCGSRAVSAGSLNVRFVPLRPMRSIFHKAPLQRFAGLIERELDAR